MSIITISRGTYSGGKELAEKLADRLGYKCISRDILLEASNEFNIPEAKLVRALHDAPSVLNRFTYGKKRYVAFIRKELLERVLDDNVVYHGLAGHFLLREVPHVLKVRIVADLEDRVKEEMKRENISAEEARRFLKRDDEERRKWSLSLYGIDTADASLYDMVIRIGKLRVDAAVDILADAVEHPCFQSSAKSRKVLADLALAAIGGDVERKTKFAMGKVMVVRSERTAAESDKDGPTTGRPEDKPEGERLRVMILDDEPEVGKRLKPSLTRAGFNVEAFQDPTVALTRLKEQEFDVIVTDFQMDVMDGIQVLEHIMERCTKTRVILITAYGSVEVAREALTKGAFDFVAKPFKPKELRAVVNKAALSLGHKSVNF